MLEFKCRDIDMDCDYETSAETEGQLLAKIAEHADEAHDIKMMSPELMDKVLQAVTV